MSAYRQTKQDNALGRFLLISFVLHLLVLIIYPQWQVSSLPGTMPGDGAIQFSLREVPDNQALSMVPVTPHRLPPQPTPRPRPVDVTPEPVPDPPQPRPEQRPVVAEVPPVPQPQVRPEPAPPPVQREPVQVESLARPQPQPQPTERPVVENPPVVTSDVGNVPVSTRSEETTESSPTGDGVGEATGADNGVAEAETPAAPAPPPPPPTVGSMIRLPGGLRLPKNLEDIGSEISIRVLITVDDQGRIVESSIDPTTRSNLSGANEFAVRYAESLIQAQPGPEGQAYQAALVVTFNPNALDPQTGGVVFSSNPDEQVRLLETD